MDSSNWSMEIDDEVMGVSRPEYLESITKAGLKARSPGTDCSNNLTLAADGCPGGGQVWNRS